MKRRSYNIVTDAGLVRIFAIDGDVIEVQGRKCLFHYFEDCFRLTDLLTGTCIARNSIEESHIFQKRRTKVCCFWKLMMISIR